MAGRFRVPGALRRAGRLARTGLPAAIGEALTPAHRRAKRGIMQKRALPQLSECLVGVGDSFGVDVSGGSPVGDFLPVGPGEYPLDREYLGGP